MLTWLLYIAGLIATVSVLAVIFGKALGRGEIMPPLVDNVSLQQLNTEAIAAHAFEDVRFDTVLRGYRQDQVDAVIAQLVAQIESLRGEPAREVLATEESES